MFVNRAISLCAAFALAIGLVPAMAFAEAGSEGPANQALIADSGASILDSALSTQSVDEAKAALDAARAAQKAAQEAVDADNAVPVPTENKEAWTALGLFKYVRDNAAPDSAEYWDAQCAIDILTSGKNSTGHAYGLYEGPVPDGTNASKWADISKSVSLSDRGDAVALENFKKSLDYIDELNATRKRHNEERGASLTTNVGMNCRQMAISIVQADASRDYTVGHTRAYQSLENLHWGRGFDPYNGWYDEERSLAESGETDHSKIGHYLTIIDMNSGAYAALAGFAVATSNVPVYGTCNELSLYYRFSANPGVIPAPTVSYSVDEFKAKYFNAYYEAQVVDGMVGVRPETKAAHKKALDEATAAAKQAEKNYLAEFVGAASAAGFGDLDAKQWYMGGDGTDGGYFSGSNTLYLDFAIGRGLMSGYTAASFGPNDQMNRGMAATIIYRMATGATADTTDNNVNAGFSDVRSGTWYAAAVKWCSENGIATGYTDGSGRFGPLDPVTREQLTTMIARYCEKVKGMPASDKDVSQFNDSWQIHNWATDGVAFCVSHGIVSGLGDTGSFGPRNIALRCQMSKIIAVTALMVE